MTNDDSQTIINLLTDELEFLNKREEQLEDELDELHTKIYDLIEVRDMCQDRLTDVRAKIDSLIAACATIHQITKERTTTP